MFCDGLCFSISFIRILYFLSEDVACDVDFDTDADLCLGREDTLSSRQPPCEMGSSYGHRCRSR